MGTDQRHDGERVIERWDLAFRALSAEPRRQLIVSLMDAPAERRVSLPEAAMSPTVPPDPATLRRNLRHRHLPLLDDHGYVRWEQDRFRAQRGPRFEEVAVVLDALQSRAETIPDQLVSGCQRLEHERRDGE